MGMNFILNKPVTQATFDKVLFKIFPYHKFDNLVENEELKEDYEKVNEYFIFFTVFLAITVKYIFLLINLLNDLKIN